MTGDKLLLLHDEIADLHQAADHLRFSLERTRALLPGADWSPEDMERLEALTSRFARLSDLLTQRIMRLVDDIELIPAGTLLDRMHRAEKRGWINDARDLVRIRELRNLIAHEYAADKMAEIYSSVAVLAPDLLALVPRVAAYVVKLEKRYSSL
ncbi:MAG: hypothetical protein COZ24_01170 [Hydrogenophilales bacterium CG_4_10_14_3_um_filter_63_21]|nr:MAG: hypothetical protein COZ24_01170 [Hydrogenophilales bacterium CG_4_10_14_3_um_filter_63_21]